jgi:dienelactone hydrolase
MLAQVFTPPGPGPFPAVLVLHGTEGFTQHHAQLAQFLSQHGYVGIAGCWFTGHFNGGTPARGNQGPPAYNNPLGIDCPKATPFVALAGGTTWPDAVTSINDLVAAVRTLPSVKPAEIGLVGHSRGSIAALTVAAEGAGVQAVVAADGTPATNLASQVGGTVLLIQGLSDTTISPQSTMAFEAALKAAGKSVQDDYVSGAPHTLIWTAPWQADADNRIVTFFQQTLP